MVIAYRDKKDKEILMDVHYFEHDNNSIYWRDWNNEEWLMKPEEVQWFDIHVGDQWISVVNKEED